MKRSIMLSAVTVLVAATQFACRDIPTQPLSTPSAVNSRPQRAITVSATDVAGVSIVDLGLGIGNAINDAGTIAGYVGAYPSGTTAEVWYVDGRLEAILADCPPACFPYPFPGCDPLGDSGCQPGGGSPSVGFGLNSSGKVVGYYSYNERFLGPFTDAFIWTDGAPFLFSPFRHHHDTRLYAINDAGQAAGSYFFDGPGLPAQTHAALRAPDGSLRDLGAPVGTKSVAFDLNARGDAVGQSPGPDDNGGEAILWPAGGGAVRLGFLGGNFMSAARAINDAGTVVGWVRGAAFNKAPFRWSTEHGMEALPTLGNGGAADGINNDGYIVGTVYLQPYSSLGHAALWTPEGQLIDLGTLAGGQSDATDVNSHVQISGSATDASGQRHVVRWDVSIVSNHPPIADAHGPYTAPEGAPTAFNGSASDQDGDALAVMWMFGDGESAPSAISSHSYVDNGTYTATLTATDPQGLSASSSATVTVANVAPSVHLDVPSQLSSGESFTLAGTFTDPGVRDMPWQYQIDWGIGVSTTGSTNSQTASIAAASAPYCIAGDYTVRLSVTDKDGGTGSATTRLSVSRIGVPVKVLTEAVNPRSQGELPVAILSTSAFDARQVDVATLTLGDGGENAAPVARHPNGGFFASVEDVNGDGRPDLLLHFGRQALSSSGILAAPTTRLWLFGRLMDGCREIGGASDVSVLNRKR